MERVICNQVLYQEVARELGLDVKVVKEIIDVQSEYTKMIIESNTFDSVRWPYLGKFSAKWKEVQMINHLKGMTPEQAADFKRAVRTGKVKLFDWDKKKGNGNNNNFNGSSKTTDFTN